MSNVPATAQASSGLTKHLPVLDGVRAVSIIAVLITHLLPVRFGGQAWNESVGMFGMALFFVLSGYLITVQLLQRPAWHVFAARRLLRIVPAAWLCIAIVCVFMPISARTLLANLLFYANIPRAHLVAPIDHFWSLCVEVQFYALAVSLLLVRPAFSWSLLPLALIGVTVLRIFNGATAGSGTWYRADDVLAGAVLALIMHSKFSTRFRSALQREWIVVVLFVALCAASVIPKTGVNWLAYFRSYSAAALVGALMYQPDARISRWLCNKSFAYIASISYALYIWHLPLAATWLGSGDLLEKYLKRPLLMAAVFAAAHLSTFYFEQRFVAWGRQIGKARSASPRGDGP